MFRESNLALAAMMTVLLLAPFPTMADETARHPDVELLLQRFDANQDEAISPDELDDRGDLVVGRFDTNGDGTLSGDELLEPAFRFITAKRPVAKVEMKRAYEADAQSGLYLQAASDYHARTDGHALLIVHQGAAIFERYYRGYPKEMPHWLASGTKSFSGVAAACAVADGILEWDEPVSDTITEWQDDPQRAGMTVRHLLSLSSGLDPYKEELKTGNHQDFFAACLQAPQRFRPGRVFRYGPSHYYVFGELMKRKLGGEENVLDYLERRLFQPLGMDRGKWATDGMGQPLLPGGAALVATEWVKFGQLVVNEGRVGETQVVPKELLDECFKPSQANKSYGLTWWLHTGRRGEWFPDDVWAAKGKGKQRLYVIRSLDLVIVRFADNERGFDDGAFLSWLLRGKPVGP